MNENLAFGEVPRHTINMSRNDSGSFGMEENVAYGQVPQRCINKLRNEAYGAFPTSEDHDDV